MDPLKTITIYDIPDDTSRIQDGQDKKSGPSDSSNTNSARVDAHALNKRFREEIYLESSIPSILLKNIIYNCIPIESEDHDKKPSSVSAGSLDTKPHVESSALKKSRHARTKGNYVLHVQFPMAILVFVEGRGFTVRAAGDTITLVGIIFDSSRSYIQTPYVFYTNRDTSIQNRAMLGTLGLRSLVHRYKYPKVPRIANFYTHDILFNEVGAQRTSSGDEDRVFCGGFLEKKLAIRFYDDKDALSKIHQVQQLLLARELHYGISFGQTMRNLSSYVISTLDFKSKQNTTKQAPIQLTREQTTVIKLLGIPESDGNRATGIIYSTGLYELYLKLLTHSMTISEVSEQSQAIGSRRKRVIVSEQLSMKKIADTSNTAWREAISRREFQRPLADLEKTELEIVTTTYERESNHANALLNNKCAHNRLYRIVMASRDMAFDMQKWIKLRELLDVPKINPATVEEIPKFESLIPCSRCKFAALCPHNYVMFEYNEKLFGGDESVCTQYILDNMTSKQTLSDGSYCRICGELLQRVSIESESWVNLAKSSDTEPIDQLHVLIIDEVAQTLNANLDLSHSSINRTNLTQSIANSISQWIRRYELKLSRVKTNTELVISFSLGLIVAIYTMMSLVHLIVLAGSAGSGITIKTIDTRGETALKLLHTLFNGIYKLLITQRANVIEKIIAFTPDRIKKIMTRSYGQISGVPVTIETTKVVYHMDLVTDNPYYYFLHYLWRIGELLKVGDVTAMVPSEYTSVRSIIGVDLDKVMELRDFFVKAKMPTAWKVPIGESSAWMNYCWKTCSQFATRLLAGTMMLDSINTQEITNEYNATMKTRASLLNNLNSIDTLSGSGLNYALSYCNLGRSRIMKSFGYDFTPPRDLNRIFCPNGPAIGQLHSWKGYLFKSKDADVDYKTSDFKTLVNPGSFKSLKCVNCGTISCGQSMKPNAQTPQEKDDVGDIPRKEESKKAMDIPLIDAMKTALRARGFFMFYKIRCPEGMFHVFKDEACEKCSFKIKQTNEECAAYLIKYISIYDVYRKKTITPQTKNVIENMRRSPEMIIQKKKQPMSWKPWVSQNEAITTASKTWSQLPYNLLINISFGSQTHFASITSGKTNPSNKAGNPEWLIQANVVVSYINTIVVSHNRFISCATRGMHPDLTEFCEKQSDTVRGLKPMDLSEFYAEQRWRIANDRPSAYANWTINKLCETLLHINTISAVAARFIEIMIDIIVESELNMSKSIIYKNIMIAASKSAIDVSGEEIDSQETDVEAKEFIKSIIDEGEEFGSGNIDIDDIAASRGDDDI